MGRKPRVLYSGGIYHVIQRGNNRKYIFDNEEDKAMFLELLDKTMSKYPFQLLYYVIMDNHFHLLIETTDASLDLIVKYVTMMYSKYYNRKYNRTGTLYEGRYSLTLVKDTRYFLQLVKYIAYNPIRANLVKLPAAYRWSAHSVIKERRKSKLAEERMLSFFDLNTEKAFVVYMKFVDENKVFEKKDLFCISEKNREQTATALALLFKDCVPEELLQVRIMKRDRSREVSACRREFAAKAFYGGFLIVDIANFLGITPHAVRSFVKEIV